MAGRGIDTNSTGANGEATRYRECRRNHAASMGRYSFDGCGEFYKGGEEGTPEALLCGACGCHRNFHRKETPTTPPPPPPMIIQQQNDHVKSETLFSVEMTKDKKKKKLRSRLTEEQKKRMRAFAESCGWRPEMHDEEEICHFCSELGITHQLFNVWVTNKRRYSTEAEPPQGGGGVPDYPTTALKEERE